MECLACRLYARLKGDRPFILSRERKIRPTTNGERDESHNSSIFGFGRGVRGIASEHSLLGSSNGRPQWTIRLRQLSLRVLLPNLPDLPNPNASKCFLRRLRMPFQKHLPRQPSNFSSVHSRRTQRL